MNICCGSPALCHYLLMKIDKNKRECSQIHKSEPGIL